MANFYLDVSALGNEYQAYAATPTWGGLSTDKPLPMDGNGKAGPGHAAAVAIAEIQITVQPADTNTLVIAGATVTAKTTVAAKNQFALGGTIAITVSNLVALINTFGTASNQCDAAVNAGTCQALLPLPYWQFARVKPGATDTLQIATRIAGSTLNYASPNLNVAITSAGWATPPTITQFAGGADGPFAYLVSNSAVFGKASKGYGLMTVLLAAAPTDPGLTTDAIIVRTRRSGADLSVTLVDTTTRYDWITAPASTSRQYLFDDGTTWAGDAGVLTLSLTNPTGFSGGVSTINPSAAINAYASASGQRFRVYVAHPAVSTAIYCYVIKGVSASQLIFDGVVVEEDSALNSTSSGLAVDGTSNTNQKFQVSNSRWIARAGRVLAPFGSNPGSRYQYCNTTFEYFGLTANVSGIVNIGATGTDQCAEFIGCTFFDRNGVYSVVSPITGGASGGTSHKVSFDGCSGVSGVASGWTAAVQDNNRILLWENFGPYRDWRVEVGAWLAEWRAGQNHPTLTSTLQNGLAWSVRVLLRNIMAWGTPQRPFKVNGFYRASTAVKTITLELLAQQVFPKAQLGILVAYIDSGDVVRYEHTLESRGKFVAGLGSNVSTSMASWTLNGQTGFTAYRLQLTTAYAIKANTDFLVFVLVNGTIGSDQTLYFNGEVALT